MHARNNKRGVVKKLSSLNISNFIAYNSLVETVQFLGFHYVGGLLVVLGTSFCISGIEILFIVHGYLVQPPGLEISQKSKVNFCHSVELH